MAVRRAAEPTPRGRRHRCACRCTRTDAGMALARYFASVTVPSSNRFSASGFDVFSASGSSASGMS